MIYFYVVPKIVTKNLFKAFRSTKYQFWYIFKFLCGQNLIFFYKRGLWTSESIKNQAPSCRESKLFWFRYRLMSFKVEPQKEKLSLRQEGA